jgi:hypothetical protein
MAWQGRGRDWDREAGTVMAMQLSPRSSEAAAAARELGQRGLAVHLLLLPLLMEELVMRSVEAVAVPAQA